MEHSPIMNGFIQLLNQYSNKMSWLNASENAKNEEIDLRKSTSSTAIESPIQHLEYLISILKCPLCNSQAKKAQMCPNCCKMFCERCVKNWILAKKQECPSCAKSLNYNATVQCQVLAQQIQEAISKVSGNLSNSSISSPSCGGRKGFQLTYSSPNLCTANLQTTLPNAGVCIEHQLNLDYYCEICKVSICSDCAVLGLKHQSHRICKYGQKRLKFEESLDRLVSNLKSFRKQLIAKRQQQIQMIENIHRFEQEKKQIFNAYMKRVRDVASAKLNSALQIKSQLLHTLQSQLQITNNQYKRMAEEIQSQQKCSLIRNLVHIENQIQKVIDFDLKPIYHRKDMFQNEITPPYGSKTFVLDNYTYLRQKGDILYSEPLFWKGIEWRLKIFPAGIQENSLNSKSSDKFLAIYLQMSRGHLYPNLYKYQILLINQLDRSKAIGCAFENEFEEGTYWGLDRFANISYLYSQNFIHPVKGFLQIVLNVKSPSYYHAVKNQNYLIIEKEGIYRERQIRVRKIKKQLGFKGVKLKKQSKRSWTVRALIDEQEPQVNKKRTKSSSNKVSQKIIQDYI